jgi:acetyltransferase-like isoleucine patch superfamily enzyme
MSDQGVPRTLPGDWYPGAIPDNAVVDETAYIETSFSFFPYRSQEPVGMRVGRGTCVYAGTLFDVGPRGQVTLGDYVLLNGVMVFCDAAVQIGDYALISWNVVVLDHHLLPWDPGERRRELTRAAARNPRRIESRTEARPVRIEANVWIGFNTCILPGVTIGAGAIVGARSLVMEDVAPYTVVGGNPARFIRRLEAGEELLGARC